MWSVQHSFALWESKLLHAKVDLGRPDLGLHNLALNAVPLPNLQLFQTQPAERCANPQASPTEVVHRGNELMVTYGEGDAHTIQRQVQWKVAESIDASRVVVDLVVCVQTSQLDSDPRIAVASSRSPATWLQLRQSQDRMHFAKLDDQGVQEGCPLGVYLARCPDSDIQYAQLLSPTDEIDAEVCVVETNGTNTLRTVLFGERLEKGVIRCARIRGVISDRALDEAVADELADQFRNSPMPLGAM